MKSSQANSSDPNQQASNKMMNGMAVYMPIMSLIFCISLPVAIGLYWIVGSIIAIITQLIINRYYDKKDKDEILQKCMEKAAKKQAKKKESGKKSFYEKMMEAQAGNVPTDERQSDNINRMASTRLKSYNNPATSSKGDISDRGNVTYKQGSIGSKANIMLQYQNKGNDKEGKK
jgi:YidC/Oxa1 family membrane protein insertase